MPRHLAPVMVSAALLAAVVLGGIAPSLVSACTGEQPRFETAIASAGAIARVVIVDASEYADAGRPERHRVVRSLKGSVSGEITLEDARANICGDRIGLYAGVGEEAIVAYGVPFHGATINVVWVDRADDLHPVFGSSTLPDEFVTLDDVERAVLAALPDTALERIDRPRTMAIGTLLLVSAVALLAAGPRRTVRGVAP